MQHNVLNFESVLSHVCKWASVNIRYAVFFLEYYGKEYTSHDIVDMFKGNFDRLQYLYFRAMNETSFDYHGDLLNAILDHNEDFIKNMVEYSEICKIDISPKQREAIWTHSNTDSILNKAFDEFLTTSDYAGSFGVFFDLFAEFSESEKLSEEIETCQESWFLSMLNCAQDMITCRAIFKIVSQRKPDYLLKCVKTFIKTHKSLEDFKTLTLRPQFTISDVGSKPKPNPIFQDIYDYLNNKELYEHALYVKEVCFSR